MSKRIIVITIILLTFSCSQKIKLINNQDYLLVSNEVKYFCNDSLENEYNIKAKGINYLFKKDSIEISLLGKRDSIKLTMKNDLCKRFLFFIPNDGDEMLLFLKTELREGDSLVKLDYNVIIQNSIHKKVIHREKANLIGSMPYFSDEESIWENVNKMDLNLKNGLVKKSEKIDLVFVISKE